MNTILFLILLIVIWYLIQNYISLPPVITLIINVLFGVIIILFLLQLLGVNTGIRIPIIR